MIVRLSGPQAMEIGRKVVRGRMGGVAGAERVVFGIGNMEIPGWVYVFMSPHSYTGEDVVELHLPGNPLLVRLVMTELMRGGARAAEAGEFTARAYFNGRMDLTEAEGVAAAIGARGQEELNAARQLLSGELSRRLRPMMDRLADILARLEAGIDFSEEDGTNIGAEDVRCGAVEVAEMLSSLVAQSARFERLSHQPRIVLMGRPNAGKSTLLNALAGHERAVVSEVAGTTRDVIWAEVVLQRGIVRVADAAGIGEPLSTGEDATGLAGIARQMRARALAAVEEADLVVLVRASTDDRPAPVLPREADLVVVSKVDLRSEWEGGVGLGVSAKTGFNMDLLRLRLSELAFGHWEGGAELALNARHLRAIEEALGGLRRVAGASVQTGDEVMAMELRGSLDALGRIVGQVAPDDILGRIFAAFCVGK